MTEMLFYALSIIFLTFFTTTLGVWIVHWMIHQPWMLVFHREHIEHHINKKFIDQDNKFLSLRASIPFLVFTTLCLMLGIYSIYVGVFLFIGVLLWSGMHDFFHLQFHNTNSYFNKYKWFIKIRKSHYLHHESMVHNFGILFFKWDKLFKTYK